MYYILTQRRFTQRSGATTRVKKAINYVNLPLLDPPSRLEISGYEQGTNIVAGTVLKLSCTAISGNPLATITWYKNDIKVSTKVIDRLVLFFLRTLSPSVRATL